MKHLSTLLFATMLAITSFGQYDPISIAEAQRWQNAVFPVYTSGGFKVLVKNNTTGLLQLTSYTITNDTVHGVFTAFANGASTLGLQVATPLTYKQLVTAGRNGKNGELKLMDTTAAKYLYLNATTGIAAKDTLFAAGRALRVQTATGNKAITADTVQTVVHSNKLRIGNSAASPFISTGTGTPLYHVSAPVGSLYLRTDGGVDSALYIKFTGADSAGWYRAIH